MRGTQRDGRDNRPPYPDRPDGHQHRMNRPNNDDSFQEDRRVGRSRSRSRDRDRVRDRNLTGGRLHSSNSSRFQESDNSNSVRDRDHYGRGGGVESRRDDRGSEGGSAVSNRRHHQHEDSSSWDRERDRDRERGRRGGSSEPTNTVIIKGLPVHTTEPSLYAALANFSPQSIRLISHKGSSECKGFAFVEFYSVEYAEYFVKTFAGSMGDQTSPQLIVDHRAVMIDYAAPRSSSHVSVTDHTESSGDSRRLGDRDAVKCDWLCDACGCQNFARRAKCYRCTADKSANAVIVSASTTFDANFFSEPNMTAAAPSSTLVVRGLPLFSNEDQISEMFRQYAVVKGVTLLRDPHSGMSRGIAFVAFHSIEHATHTITCFNKSQQAGASTAGTPLKVNYAKESFVVGSSSLQQQQQPYSGHLAPSHSAHALPSANIEQQQAYARAALEAAQWSAGMASAPGGGAPPSSAETIAHRAAPVAPVPPVAPSYFETHGAAYIFQPKTGIFYDNLTKFYYCPKSRLYYSEVDGRYLYAVSCDKKSGKHSPGAPPGLDYLEFVPPCPVADAPGNSASSPPQQETSENLPARRKPVTMSLGFGKKSGGSKALKQAAVIVNVAPAVTSAGTSAQAVAADLSSTVKQTSQDISKWKELQAASGISSEAAAPSVISAATRNSSEPPTIIDAAARPAEAPPPPPAVCTLCRRQFVSKEQLQRHERESKLHAANLARANLSSTATIVAEGNVDGGIAGSGVGSTEGDVGSGVVTSTVPYRDRASERRAVYGQPDISALAPSSTDWVCSKCNCENFARRLSCFRCTAPISIAHGGAVDMSSDRRRESESVTPATSLSRPPGLDQDIENPGNQMLRRLGWKDGQGLGREGAGDVETVAAKLGGQSSSSSSKRGVGAPAGSGTGGFGRAGSAYSGGCGGDGDAVDYKSGIMRAAKARYDQIADSKRS